MFIDLLSMLTNSLIGLIWYVGFLAKGKKEIKKTPSPSWLPVDFEIEPLPTHTRPPSAALLLRLSSTTTLGSSGIAVAARLSRRFSAPVLLSIPSQSSAPLTVSLAVSHRKKLLHNQTMQLATNPIHQTHYNILNVKEDATHEEIRSNYRSAILNSHPDKLQNTSPTTNLEPGSQFLNIQKAWEILGDVKSRAMYDLELRVSRQDEVMADEVELEDLAVEAGGDVVELFYQCRCGDYFCLDSLELREMGFEILMEEGEKILLRAHDGVSVTSIVLPCGSCSLKIRLVINKDTCVD